MFSRGYFDRFEFPEGNILKARNNRHYSHYAMHPNVIYYGTHAFELPEETLLQTQTQAQTWTHNPQPEEKEHNVAARLLAKALAEQYKRRQDLDRILQQHIYKKELEKRRRRHQIVEEEMATRQRRTDHPLYHGRIIQGPDGCHYKIIYHPHYKSNTATDTDTLPMPLTTHRDYTHDTDYMSHTISNPQSSPVPAIPFTPASSNEHKERQHTFVHDSDNLEDKAEFVHVDDTDYTSRSISNLVPANSFTSAPSNEHKERQHNFVHDSDNLEDKAEFVHVDLNCDMNKNLDSDIASDASVCQGRSSDDSISTHMGIFHPSLSRPVGYLPSSKPPKDIMNTTTAPHPAKDKKPKEIHSQHKSLKRNTSSASYNIKIIQGIDGRLYKVLEELDASPQGKKMEVIPQTKHETAHRYSKQYESSNQQKTSLHSKKDKHNDEESIRLPGLNDFHTQKPDFNRILDAILFDAPIQESIPAAPKLRPSVMTSTNPASQASFQLPPRNDSVQKNTKPKISNHDSPNAMHIVRGPDGRIYQLTLMDHRKNENLPSVPSSKSIEVVDARGEPKYHHVRGPDGHVYKVKNIHYHDKYPDPFLLTDDQNDDGDKTPTHDNKELNKSPDDDEFHLDAKIRFLKDKDGNIHRIVIGDENHAGATVKDAAEENTYKPFHTDSKPRNKESTFYDAVSEDVPFQFPESVTDYTHEMSSPYELVEGKDGGLHSVLKQEGESEQNAPSEHLKMEEEKFNRVASTTDEVETQKIENLSQNQFMRSRNVSHKRKPSITTKNGNFQNLSTSTTIATAGVPDKQNIDAFITTPADEFMVAVEEASDSEKEDEFDSKEHNLRPILGEWLEPANAAELHKTEVLRSHNQ